MSNTNFLVSKNLLLINLEINDQSVRSTKNKRIPTFFPEMVIPSLKNSSTNKIYITPYITLTKKDLLQDNPNKSHEDILKIFLHPTILTKIVEYKLRIRASYETTQAPTILEMKQNIENNMELINSLFFKNNTVLTISNKNYTITDSDITVKESTLTADNKNYDLNMNGMLDWLSRKYKNQLFFNLTTQTDIAERKNALKTILQQLNINGLYKLRTINSTYGGNQVLLNRIKRFNDLNVHKLSLSDINELYSLIITNDFTKTINPDDSKIKLYYSTNNTRTLYNIYKMTVIVTVLPGIINKQSSTYDNSNRLLMSCSDRKERLKKISSHIFKTYNVKKESVNYNNLINNMKKVMRQRSDSYDTTDDTNDESISGGASRIYKKTKRIFRKRYKRHITQRTKRKIKKNK